MRRSTHPYRPILAILGAGLATGCAPHVTLPPPAISLPAAFETPAPASTQTPSLDKWWLAFGDPQLETLVEQALTSATDSRLAFARLREARAVRRNAFAQTLPTGNVTLSANRQYTNRLSSNAPVLDLGSGSTGSAFNFADLFSPTGAIDSFNVGASPSWEIDLFGRLSATRAQARASFAAAYLDYEATRLSLAGDVASTLFEARGYAAQLEDAGETLRIARALSDAARLGVARGLTAGSDADRLDTDRANAEAEMARITNQFDTSRRTLLVLIGRATENLASLAIVPDRRDAPDVPAATPASLLQRRPDVRAAEMRLIAASAQARIDRAALFPKLTLQPGATLSGSNSPVGATNFVWQVGAGLALPILNRPVLMAQLRITQARGEQVVIQYEQAVQTAFREADRALAAVAIDRRRQAALARAQGSARRAFDAKQIGFKLGLNDLTTLLQAETTWRTTRNALTVQQTTSLQNTVTAFRALGGGWTPAADAGAAGKSLTDTESRP